MANVPVPLSHDTFPIQRIDITRTGLLPCLRQPNGPISLSKLDTPGYKLKSTLFSLLAKYKMPVEPNIGRFYNNFTCSIIFFISKISVSECGFLYLYNIYSLSQAHHNQNLFKYIYRLHRTHVVVYNYRTCIVLPLSTPMLKIHGNVLYYRTANAFIRIGLHSPTFLYTALCDIL